MDAIDTVVIGAGHAGLAMSAILSAGGRDHVVLDRGRTGERWRSERWDSLRLLTPNWTIRLPGYDYDGPDPDGYMTADEVVDLLDRYREALELPVAEGTTVLAVDPSDTGFRVTTSHGGYQAASVIVATGHCDVPNVPAASQQLSGDVTQLTSSEYRNPQLLAPGGVLVVGASATGLQIADEIAHTGREVVLAAGSHTRMPRFYRGMDVMWWLEAVGSLDRSVDAVPDIDRAMREPSLQLVGRVPGTDLDLETVSRSGVVVTGRLQRFDGATARFAPNRTTSIREAETRLRRVLDQFDRHAEQAGMQDELGAPHRPRPVSLPPGPATLNLRSAGISTVIWATGYRRDHGWVHTPAVIDGELRQRYGVTTVPGLFTVGQRFQTRRNSSFIGGASQDAALVAAHLDALRPIRRTAVLSLRGRS